MKNMIEVPSEKDFHKTMCVEVTHDEINGVHKIHHRKINLAMRSITDFTSVKMEFTVIDEEKVADYENEIIAFKEKLKSLRAQNEGPVFLEDERPEPPIKKITVVGTIVFYYNTTQRIIIDDFDNFEETYFNYLKMERLNINTNK